MKRVLFTQASLAPVGGGNGVAAWILEALKEHYRIAVLTFEKPDLARINRFFGTTLKSTDFDLFLVTGWFPHVVSKFPTPLAMLKAYYLYWRCRRLAPQYDIAITADNEADMGSCGVQYVHFPRFFPHRPAVDLKWYHGFRALRWAYYRVPAWVTGFSEQRMRRNVTLVNSEYTGRHFNAVHGTKTITLYPPAIGTFPKVPWELRKRGFLIIGRIAPEKRIELAIEILKRVRDLGVEVHLHVIGIAPVETYANLVRDLVKANAAWVSLHENLSRTELLQLISTHRYGLHAMKDEPFGMAVAELVSGGCIPFVYNGGGPVEIVDHDPWLIYDTAEEAAEKIAQTLQDDSRQMVVRERLARRKELFTTQRFVLGVRESVAAADNCKEPITCPSVTECPGLR